MAITLDESGLRFVFDGDAVKFDETAYYRNYAKNQPEGKGVDFIALSQSGIQMIEVKNCRGHEFENRWRIGPNNSSRQKRLPGQDETDRDSVDIEVAKKIASSLACLYGAWTKAPRSNSTEELAKLWVNITDPRLPTDQKQLQVILFLEGNFGCQTRPKTAIMKRLQESIQKKLSWLNCKVSVIDSDWCHRYKIGFAVTDTEYEYKTFFTGN